MWYEIRVYRLGIGIGIGLMLNQNRDKLPPPQATLVKMITSPNPDNEDERVFGSRSAWNAGDDRWIDERSVIDKLEVSNLLGMRRAVN